MFKLHQHPQSLGLRCDRDGLFLGGQALVDRDEEGNFLPRPPTDLRKRLSRIYGDEGNWESRIPSVTLVANALNDGDMARATMTAVLMRLPDPDGSILITDVDGVLAKAGFNPDEPRDERGRWTNEDNSGFEPSSETRNPRTQLADADMSDASDDPVAEAAARVAATTQRNRATRDSQSKLAARQRGVLQALEDGTESLLTDIGRSQIAESNSEQAVGAAEANAISDVYEAYNSLMQRPIGGSMPITPEYPVWGYGDNAQLAPERPITVGDAVPAAGSVVSVLPFGPGARVAAESSELTALEGEFSISDWAGYPPGLPRPAGPFRLTTGKEYDAARAAANSANRILQETDAATYAGKQIHEIQPVKFGGSPTDPANKMVLTPRQHAEVTTWWNHLLRNFK